MDMKISSKLLKEQRKKRAWSQSELAELTGLSLRTVQRIEKSGTASLESVKAFAAVFELTPESLQVDAKTDLETSDLNVDKVSPNKPVKPTLFKLSDQAIQLALVVFLPACLVMLFMLFTKLPNLDWVHSVRLALFSENLPAAITLLINLTIALLPLVILCLMIGLFRDLYKQQGAANYIKQLFKRSFSLKTWGVKLQDKLKRAVYLLKKPALISMFLLIFSLTFIGLNMEPYQKANLKHFISKVLDHDDENYKP
ncbi:helix-turn-helix transcriptional regulator [Thalassotalea euphylliae]|uniref:XRE family transcriptional regulator n=1 Tax=Thalassotalea euphylliae TaxID=1655234 RepID=A0A3E0UCD9_9GAMM|nr:helix-turn-helix transcriptional regulator [Thalassotalea euphylliae]REL34671.1 XRE family transcriptional regulator [Thalassotalea euphylliae]